MDRGNCLNYQMPNTTTATSIQGFARMASIYQDSSWAASGARNGWHGWNQRIIWITTQLIHCVKTMQGEHEREDALAGCEPVTAVAPSQRFDRQSQIVQPRHIPANRPLVYAEPFCQLGNGAQLR